MYMNSLTTLAVDVPAAVIVTSSIRLPEEPAVKTVPTLVGAVREVSPVAIETALNLGVAAKLGVVARKLISPYIYLYNIDCARGSEADAPVGP